MKRLPVYGVVWAAFLYILLKWDILHVKFSKYIYTFISVLCMFCDFLATCLVCRDVVVIMALLLNSAVDAFVL